MKTNQDNLIIINKENITHALSHLVGIVEKARSANDKLSHVKIDPIDEQSIKITATNLDISVVEIVLVERSNIEQSFTLPAVTLYEIVKKFPPKSLLILQQVEHTVEITSNAIFFALPFLDAQDFPSITEDKMPISLSLSQEHFNQLFSKTKFVISTEESRYNLTGLYLHEAGGKLRSAATDAHRMAVASPDVKATKFGILISRKTVMELVRIFETSKRTSENSSDEIKVYISNKKVKFIYNNITLLSKLIAADFPNYQNIIPKTYTREAVINKGNFIEAIERVSAIYNDKSRSINLLFSSDNLKISASTANSSNAHENLTIHYIGEKFDIKFNYNYLLEICAHLDSDNVKFYFNTSDSAAMIENNQIIYIVMPMSV